MNIQPKNSINGNKSVPNETQKLILSAGKALLLVIMIVIIVYFIYYTYKYYSIQCATKIPLYQYLTNFGNGSFCILEPIPIESEENKLNITNNIQNNIQNNNEKKNISDEVFQISNQLYTYDEAKCKCESYGGR